MQHVLNLLREKNNCLIKFQNLNESEIVKFNEGNFDNIESFYKSREGLLEMISKLDKLIGESQQLNQNPELLTPRTKKSILDAIAEKNDVVTHILSQDLQILSYIEAAKSDIIKELSQVKTARKAVSAYKSNHSTKKLDEEY